MPISQVGKICQKIFYVCLWSECFIETAKKYILGRILWGFYFHFARKPHLYTNLKLRESKKGSDKVKRCFRKHIKHSASNVAKCHQLSKQRLWKPKTVKFPWQGDQEIRKCFFFFDTSWLDQGPQLGSHIRFQNSKN